MGGSSEPVGGKSRNAAPYRSFGAFYPFYLSQHADRTCRRLHFFGTTLGLAAAIAAFVTLDFWWIAAGQNRPATFAYPLYSFCGDWVMWRDMLTGRIRF